MSSKADEVEQRPCQAPRRHGHQDGHRSLTAPGLQTMSTLHTEAPPRKVQSCRYSKASSFGGTSTLSSSSTRSATTVRPRQITSIARGMRKVCLLQVSHFKTVVAHLKSLFHSVIFPASALKRFDAQGKDLKRHDRDVMVFCNKRR